MKIRFDPPGHEPRGPDSTAEARIEVSFRPKEIEGLLIHVGGESKATSESEVKFRFRGEMTIDFDPHRDGDDDVLGMTLNVALESKE